MSIWADIFDRSTGDTKRKEDRFLSIDEIANILKSMDVNPALFGPVKSFHILTEDNILFSMVLCAEYQDDGSKNFYSNHNISLFEKFIEENGNILKIE